MLVASCKEPGAWSAEPERNAESLRRPNDDVGTKLTWWSDETAREKIGCDRDESASDMCGVDSGGEVANRTARTGVRKQDTEHIVSDRSEGVGNLKNEAERLRSCLKNRQRLWMRVAVDDESVTAFAVDSVEEGHRLGCCS